MSRSAFYKYAPYIQEYIYEKGWQDLREVQEEACEAILDYDGNVIIASGTASGKTEAAFFPVLTLLEKREWKSVSVLYIGPLKALINDQFERLNELLERHEIPLTPWHGEISASVKNRLFKNPSGIVQITPESLESMMMNHSKEIHDLFKDLQFIIIDEIHAFMGSDRGAQLQCLMERLIEQIGHHPRRIGLSATLADYEPAGRWLCGSDPKGFRAVGLSKSSVTVSIGFESYVSLNNPEMKKEMRYKLLSSLFEQTLGRKSLIFANSRRNCEELTADLKSLAEIKNKPDQFYVHHSNVAQNYRRMIENKMKQPQIPVTIAATTTLELGIDIGDLDLCIQYDAPSSCSSFIQRLGRSGRRTGIPKMIFYSRWIYPDQFMAFDSLPWDFLQSLAIVLLYLEDYYIEPFTLKEKPFSLLVHQTLSLLFQKAEFVPANLARQTLCMPPFAGKVSKEEYLELLKYMLEKEWIEKTETGTILPAEKADRLCSHYSFYAVFSAPEEWKVFSEKEIGVINQKPALDDVFILAGSSWRVVEVLEAKKTVKVIPTKSGTFQPVNSRGADIDDAIVIKIREILSTDTPHHFLKNDSAKLLNAARVQDRRFHLSSTEFYILDDHYFIICPWMGTKLVRTLERLFICGLKKELQITGMINCQFYLYVESKLNAKAFLEACHQITLDPEDPALVLFPNEAPAIDKYDSIVPKSLLRKAYLHNQMEVEKAWMFLKKIH